MTGYSIVCATSVAGGEEAFATLGHVRMMPEQAIDRASLEGVDVLITRSKVNITNHLLPDHGLLFYGTATAGIDHVDVPALAARGIPWSAAPGSNATSVAEYVIAALARFGLKHGTTWRGKTLAIIGAGHVGMRLAGLAPALGLAVRLNDPPKRDATGDPRYENLRDVLADADVVSLHVPRTTSGRYPTNGMVDEAFLRGIKPGALFINASRGEVIASEQALVAARMNGRLGGLLLDVFHHEPGIDEGTMAGSDLATPHIAGYSLDARWRGTAMVYEAACRCLGVSANWHLPAPASRQALALAPIGDDEHTLFDFITRAYDPWRDDEALRALSSGRSMATHFSALRQHYPVRHEFNFFRAENLLPARANLRARIAQLGFFVDSPFNPASIDG